MKGRLIVAGALAAAVLPALPAAARAQGPECSGQNTVVQDACQKAVDMFQFLAPQLGTSIAGGAAIQGSGGTLGGLGHFSVGLRANAVGGALPQVSGMSVAVDGAHPDQLPTKAQVLGLPAMDAAVGVYKGFPLGVTRVGGVDLLVNASYVPEIDRSGFALATPDGSLKLGVGARVGLLQESLVMPGVSVTYLRRDMPTMGFTASYQGNGAGEDTLQLSGLSLKTDAWRVVASKSLFLFGVAVGAGQDRYQSSGDLRAVVRQQTVPGVDARYETTPVAFDQSLTRTNYFANLSMNLLMVRIVGEVGQVSGGNVPTYNTFGDRKADDSLLYGSVGLRVGF